MKKILVVRYETIGDTIFASAFYRELRNALPDAQIDVIADDTSRPIMKYCPYINNIIDSPGKYRKYLDYFRLLNQFKKYDTIYCLKNNHFYSKLAYLAGIKNRVGFEEKARKSKYLNMTIPYREDRHEIDLYLDLLRLTNIPVTSDRTECWLSPETSEKVNELLSANGKKKVLIQAYSRLSLKNWFDKYWAEVIKHLSNELDIQVYFSGNSSDREEYEKINQELSDLKIKPINTSGKLSLTETMSLVKNMDMVIGIDSCISHISAGLDIPQIFLIGPTSLVRWKPRNEKCIVIQKEFPCSPCFIQSVENIICDNRRDCMKAITPDLVIKELDKHFANKKTS